VIQSCILSQPHRAVNPHSQRLIAASKSKANTVPKAQAKAKAKPKAKSSAKKGKGNGETAKGGKSKGGKGKDGKSKAKTEKQKTQDGEGLSAYSAAKKKFLEDPSTLGLIHILFA